MREIRVRVWDEAHKRMISKFYVPIGRDKTIYILTQFKDGTIGAVREGEAEILSPIQYTGLHDRNGKEIWEGDIVIIDGGLKWVCGWSDNHARFYFDTGLHKTDDFDSHEPYNFEVIGNIYENPDLLK